MRWKQCCIVVLAVVCPAHSRIPSHLARQLRRSKPQRQQQRAVGQHGPVQALRKHLAHFHFDLGEKWHMLSQKLLADVTAASAAALSVSPFIAVIDRSIVLSTSRGGSVSASVMAGLGEMVNPVAFFKQKEVWWVWMLYAGTFLAANTIATVAEEWRFRDTYPKLIGTTSVNLPGCIWKDEALAKMFGAPAKMVAVGAAATAGATAAETAAGTAAAAATATAAAAAVAQRMPLLSYALFTIRDVLSIAASFTLPGELFVNSHKRLAYNSDVMSSSCSNSITSF
jgi:hypothetical protein